MIVPHEDCGHGWKVERPQPSASGGECDEWPGYMTDSITIWTPIFFWHFLGKKGHSRQPQVAMGGTIWRFNQWSNFAWKWFNSIFDSKENCQKWFNSIFNSKENCQDSIQKKYSIRRKKPGFNSKKYSIQNYSWPIQFNNIFNSKLLLANSIQWNIQLKSWISRGIAWWIDYIS